MRKFLKIAVFAFVLSTMTACGDGKTQEQAATQTGEKSFDEAASIVGKWKLNEVIPDLENLPKEMKDKLEADPKVKERMNEGLKKMINDGMLFDLMADGNAKVIMSGVSEDAKYEYKDKMLVITDKRGAKTVNITELSAGALAFTMQEGGLTMSMKFVKQ